MARIALLLVLLSGTLVGAAEKAEWKFDNAPRQGAGPEWVFDDLPDVKPPEPPPKPTPRPRPRPRVVQPRYVQPVYVQPVQVQPVYRPVIRYQAAPVHHAAPRQAAPTYRVAPAYCPPGG